jgi:hypothetical protein
MSDICKTKNNRSNSSLRNNLQTLRNNKIFLIDGTNGKSLSYSNKKKTKKLIRV